MRIVPAIAIVAGGSQDAGLVVAWAPGGLRFVTEGVCGTKEGRPGGGRDGERML